MIIFILTSTREFCYIADVVWNDTETKDIRDVLQIAKLVRNIEDVQDVARTLIKYRPKPKTKDDE